MKVETLYHNDISIQEAIADANPLELIQDLRQHFKELAAMPVPKSETTLTGRKQYISDRTADILIQLIQTFGKQYPAPIIELVAEQEFWLHHKLVERINLFAYLVSEIQTVEELKSTEVFSLVYFAFREGAPLAFEKSLHKSVGTKGDGVRGFMNDLYTRPVIHNEKIGIHFRLEIPVHHYHFINWAKSMGVNEELLHELDNIADGTRFLTYKRLNGFKTSHRRGEVFESCLRQVANELHPVLTKEYSDFHVSVSKFFETHETAETEFFLTVEKVVWLQRDYKEVKQELIATIHTFNEMEGQFFGFEFMVESLAKLEQEWQGQGRNQPLFG